MEPVKVALAQILVVGGAPEANLARAERAIAGAARAGCALVVLPECVDFGWGDPAARGAASPVPGAVSERLAAAARAGRIHVAAGVVERDGERLYNTALLLAPGGEILARHRKVNELPVGRHVYATGSSLGVVETPLGTVGLAVCADTLPPASVGRELCEMGARLILSPSAWAVDADAADEPYGELWLDVYRGLARDFGATVVGVSNVGRITGGGWAGRVCVGSSLAVGPSGVLARGPQGVDAEALVVADLPRPPSD